MSNAYIAMSGGVDSSAAALLTQRAGHQITGVTLRLHDKGGCGSGQDARDAAAVCKKLNAPHKLWDGEARFREKVTQPFAQEYLEGKTPNPCIRCNRWLKFGLLLDRALKEGADFVVTGHYARVCQGEDGRWLLKTGKNPQKDQSYVLYSLTQRQLAHLCLPLGELDKEQVREIARQAGFENAGKPDSQDICFVPDGYYARYIWETTGHQPQPGDFVDLDGCILGQHAGLECYTIGQRRGIGISASRPYYVVGKNADRNTVILGEEEDLYTSRLYAGGLNWIAFEALTQPVACAVRTRYHQKETPCTIYPEGDRVRVELESPVRAAAPGQAAVFYQDDLVLGGGTIL